MIAVAALGSMLEQPFMRYALLAGTFVALATGLAGYFLVLRGQVFVGDALSHVAVTGALAALAAGVDLRLGLFAATVGVGLVMAGLGERGRADDVVIGAVFAAVLGLGVLFLALFTQGRSSANGGAATRVLFGSIFGLDFRTAAVAAAVGTIVSIALLLVARPLLFASLDPQVAAAHNVPVRAVGAAFLALVGAGAAEASQAVGALLLLGLLAGPGGAALKLSARPFAGLALSAGLAVGAVWVGLAASYLFPSAPPSFSILAVVTLTFAAASLVERRLT